MASERETVATPHKWGTAPTDWDIDVTDVLSPGTSAVDIDPDPEPDVSPCECCGADVEPRYGVKYHHTCIECSRAGCSRTNSACDQKSLGHFGGGAVAE